MRIKNKIEISCKYCGCLDGVVESGKPPHAYAAICSGCHHHNRWLSKYDVEDIGTDGLIADLYMLREERENNQSNGVAINYGLHMSVTSKINKIETILNGMGIDAERI